MECPYARIFGWHFWHRRLRQHFPPDEESRDCRSLAHPPPEVLESQSCRAGFAGVVVQGLPLYFVCTRATLVQNCILRSYLSQIIHEA